MRFILATGERLGGLLVQKLIALGHSVQGVIVPERTYLHEKVDAPFWQLGRWSLQDTCHKHRIPLRFARYLHEGATQALIKQANPDLLLVMGWPKMIADESLALFRHGGMNIHPSVLPQLRGADPLFHALRHGIDQIGITFHRITQQRDAGPIYFQAPLSVGHDETYAQLYLRVVKASANLLSSALEGLMNNPQGASQRGEVSEATTFEPAMQSLDVSMAGHELERLCRACYDHHPLRFSLNGCQFDIGRVSVVDRVHDDLIPHGFIKRRSLFSLTVRCGTHWVMLDRLRPVGRSRLLVPWLLWSRARPGQLLG